VLVCTKSVKKSNVVIQAYFCHKTILSISKLRSLGIEFWHWIWTSNKND